MKSRSFVRVCATSLVCLAVALDAAAQYNRPKEPIDPSLSYSLVKTGLHMISGKGGNALLRLSGNGLVLVDGNLPGNDGAVLKAASRISDQPVRLVILTSLDKWQTADSEKFLATGALLAVQENAKDKLTASVPAEAAAQIKSYEREHLTRIGGVEVEVMHFGNAHTNADTVVYFPNLKVVAVGGLVSPSPTPDFSAGGSLLEWGAVLEQVLKLDFDTAVPNFGPPITRAEVEAYKLKIDTLTSRSKALVAQGVPKDQFMNRLKVDDLGWQLTYDTEHIDRLYAEMSQADAATHQARLGSQALSPK